MPSHRAPASRYNGKMRTIFAILLLFPLAAAAAQWRYNGDIAMSDASSAGGSAPTMVAMTGTVSAMPANTPTNSMTMNKVRASFGEPDKIAPAVGDPPITRWQYPEYVVYFEYDRVITSVGGHL